MNKCFSPGCFTDLGSGYLSISGQFMFSLMIALVLVQWFGESLSVFALLCLQYKQQS